MEPSAKRARQNARQEIGEDVNWLRRNYGWRAKKAVWATLAFGVLVAVALIVAFGQ